MHAKIKGEIKEFRLLIKSVPTTLIIIFVASVFAMNLLANKSIDIPVDWLALDCGIIVSWFAFLAMDIITKHFGPKAACEISLFATAVNLAFCLILFIGSIISGSWGESFNATDGAAVNAALDRTFGGTWYVLLGSTLAFVVSAVVNNVTNWAIGKAFKKNPDGAAAYVLRSYVSTAIGQFIDNLIFALLVSHFFFGWTVLQCVTCALTGMVAELLCEVVFSWLGYATCRRLKANGVGVEYFEYREERKRINESADNGNE